MLVIKKYVLIKDDSRIIIDANAVAQGQSSDIIAKLLEANGCKNYMIEIGGEVACKGLSPSNSKWRIGIDKAIDDTTNTNNGLQAVVEMSSGGMTTAGSYRKFYIKDGKKYAHIIDPHTGMPVSHNLLSATVIAPTALLADAYDTAFMVMGIDSSLAVCKRIPGLECYLIYVDESGNNQVIYSPGFKKYLAK
jgi:FAD:protein FMN transferase